MPDKHPDAVIFSVETRFQKMAQRPGGIPRDQALERANAQVNELKPGFAEWLDQELENFVAAIRKLEANPVDPALLDDSYEKCCRLRDVGSTMGYELISFVSNLLCEQLEAIKAGTSYDKESIDLEVDALVLSSKAPYCHLRPDQLPEMTSGLRRIFEHAKSRPPK